MDRLVHKTQEKVEQAGHRIQEGVVRNTGDPNQAEVLKGQHQAEEAGHAGANRIGEGLNRVVDTLSGKETTGQKVDRALGNNIF